MKPLEEILYELFNDGKRCGEDIGYAKDEVLYEMRETALIEAKQEIIELIDEEIDKLTVYYRSKFSLFIDRGETEEEMQTEMVELSMLKKILQKLNE